MPDAAAAATALVWGPGHARSALLAAGASDTETTEEWVTNQYRWVVWKLAAYERRCRQCMCSKQSVHELYLCKRSLAIAPAQRMLVSACCLKKTLLRTHAYLGFS